MGLKVGRFLKKTVRSVVKRAPAIVGGFLTGGPGGAVAGLTGSLLAKGAAVGAGIPSSPFLPGGPGFPVGFPMPIRFGDSEDPGTPVPAAAGLPAIIAGMNRITAMAIARLAAALGITFTLQTLPKVGLRLWRTIMGFARRHPGVSVIGMLTALGLAADEAAHFLSWGATRARKRRGRGISARDIRVCRRTMRRMAAFQRELGALRRPRRFARRVGGGGSVVVAQQD